MCENLRVRLLLYSWHRFTGNISELTLMRIGLTAVSSIRNSYFLRGYLRLVMCTRHWNLITFKFVLFCSLNSIAVFLILKIESRSEISQKSDLCKLTGDCKGPTKLFAYWISIEIILYTCRHISFFLVIVVDRMLEPIDISEVGPLLLHYDAA